MLEKNPQDQAAWLLKCKALTKKSYVDDLEIEEEGVGDMLMGKQTYSNYFSDDNAMTQAPRPGTSFSRPLSSAGQPGGIS